MLILFLSFLLSFNSIQNDTSRFDLYETESLDNINEQKLRQICASKSQKNSTLMKNQFTEEALAPQWRQFMNDVIS